MDDFSPLEKDVLKQAIAAENKDRTDKSWEKISKRLEQDKGPAQGRLDIDDAERKNREANAKKSIQDLRELREGKITNDELKERVRSRGGSAAGVPKSGKHEMLKMKSGGKVSSASKRADGCAIRGKTRA
jgi:hypothetical protein